MAIHKCMNNYKFIKTRKVSQAKPKQFGPRRVNLWRVTHLQRRERESRAGCLTVVLLLWWEVSRGGMISTTVVARR